MEKNEESILFPKEDSRAYPKDPQEVEPVSPEEALRALRQEGLIGSDASEQVDPPSSMTGKILGQYQLQDKIGQGGMGVVFRAQDIRLNRTVALKVLRCSPLDDPKTVERFQREAMSLARLNHPNLLHVYNVGCEGEWHYFAMELLEGITFSKFLKLRKKIPHQELVPMIGQILDALHYVHGQGITHRDIKGGNIMICGNRTVLMDFGLAKDEQLTGLTSIGVVMGTPEYMAPEQSDGLSLGAPTDLYSVGIVMYEALAGEVPFKGRSAMAIIRQHLESKPPDLRERTPGVPVELARIVERCMAKSAENRYPNSPALAADLVKIVSTPELERLAASDFGKATTLQTKATALPGSEIMTHGLMISTDTARLPETSENRASDPLGMDRRDRQESDGGSDDSRPAWMYVLIGFIGMSLIWWVLSLLLAKVEPTEGKKGQVIKIEGSEQDEIRLLEFTRKGTKPSTWYYTFMIREKDGMWRQETLNDPEFRQRYGGSPILNFIQNEEGEKGKKP